MKCSEQTNIDSVSFWVKFLHTFIVSFQRSCSFGLLHFRKYASLNCQTKPGALYIPFGQWMEWYSGSSFPWAIAAKGVKTIPERHFLQLKNHFLSTGAAAVRFYLFTFLLLPTDRNFYTCFVDVCAALPLFAESWFKWTPICTLA